MILESERLLAEDLERLEQAIADRLLEDPKAVSYSDLQLYPSSPVDPPFFRPFAFLSHCTVLTKVSLYIQK